MKIGTSFRGHFIFVIFVLFLFMFTHRAYGSGQSSTNYIMRSDVLSGGGGDASSISYDLLSTTGQPTATGVSSSTNYADFAGFWYQVGEEGGVCIAPILELLLLD